MLESETVGTTYAPTVLQALGEAHAHGPVISVDPEDGAVMMEWERVDG